MSAVMRLARFALALLALSLILRVAAQQSSSSTANPSPTTAVAQPSAVASPAPPNPLHEALLLYRKGDFDGALDKYRGLVSTNQSVPEAYAGLIRTYLKKKDVQQAHETATKALSEADAPLLRAAVGEVYFREGRIPDAEQEWVKLVNSGYPSARAYLGLARVRWAIAMYKTGQTMIEKAHDLDPSDPEIRSSWTGKLSRAERIKFLEDFLTGDNNEDAETRAAMQHYLDYLKARAKDPRGACHLVSKLTTTETPLVRLLVDSIHLRGYGLTVEVNGRKANLVLDTGASGILINRSMAEHAGVTPMADMDIGGIGDKGTKRGYRALANSLKVGGLEFQNCPVEVIEKRSVVGEEGLIGADVFSSFLVDIDFPNEKLHLRELPKRPNEAPATIDLKTDEDDTDSDDESAKNADVKPESKAPAPAPPGPQDRYIAPEMKDFTRFYRFGHFVLVPTKVADLPGKLFMLDTGALTNNISPAAAREITRVHGDSDTIIQGISGSVKNVFSADKAVLQFGHIRQENQDMVSFDMTHLSDNIGTEISGTLGFTTLRFLDIKIDYRDGLIDFSYDPKRWGR